MKVEEDERERRKRGGGNEWARGEVDKNRYTIELLRLAQQAVRMNLN